MINAHANSTPHRIGQVAKARIETAALCAGAPDPDALAGRILDTLQNLGWTPPRDPNADLPPLRPDRPADENSAGRQAFRAEMERLANRPRRDDTPPASA